MRDSRPVPRTRRKSITHGLDFDFSSFDAQREPCEKNIRAQAALGVTLAPQEHSTLGYTGVNTDRPGLQRLCQDTEAGEIVMALPPIHIPIALEISKPPVFKAFLQRLKSSLFFLTLKLVVTPILPPVVAQSSPLQIPDIRDIPSFELSPHLPDTAGKFELAFNLDTGQGLLSANLVNA